MPTQIQAHSNETILVVDDTAINIDLLIRFLEPLGYKLAFADSGEMALELVPRIKPIIILLDIKMPGIDGFETCEQLKANPDTANIPIIFVTAMTDESHLAHAYRVGGVDYITKPVKRAEVVSRVETQLKMISLFRFQENIISTLNERLEALAAEFTHFGQNMRGPLSVIMGYSEIMKEDAKDEGLQGFAQGQVIIESACYKINRVLTNLLDLAKMEANKVELCAEQCTLNTILRNLNSQFNNGLKNAKLTHKVNLMPEDSIVCVDHAKIIKVMTNLIENAIKSSNHGEIIVACKKDIHRLQFTVADCGRGFGDNFEKRSLQAVLAKQKNSKGLGLNLCLKLCALMDGQILITSKQKAGSKIYFEVPINQQDQANMA